MKAWFVWAGEPYFTWGDYVHAETASKAKAEFMKHWYGETEWIYLRPHRCPELDDKPITAENIKIINPENNTWFPICKCELCRKEE